MRFKKILFLWVFLGCAVVKSTAHPMPNALVNIRVTETGLLFDLNIPFFEVQTVLGLDSTAAQRIQDTAIAHVVRDYLLRHLSVQGTDGASWHIAWINASCSETDDPLLGRYAELHAQLRGTPPPGGGSRRFILRYDAILHQIVTHQAIVSVAQDWENGIQETPQQLAVVQVDSETGQVYPVAVQLETGSIWKGFRAMFELGMGHIAEGTDHLLFLLLLLVVAPLSAEAKRWGNFGGWGFGLWRLLKIVTAFTVGHSLTLALGSSGYAPFPSRWVELAIAFSILVSAIHALRPLFFGKELWVAGTFGLVHGMAFSDVLRQLHLGKTQLFWSLAGFNLGIEAIQIGLVAIAAPLLFALANTGKYPVFRAAIAIIGIVGAVYWGMGVLDLRF